MTRRARSMRGADAYYHSVDSYVSIKVVLLLDGFRNICVDCGGICDIRLTFELLNTISARLRLLGWHIYPALPNRPIIPLYPSNSSYIFRTSRLVAGSHISYSRSSVRPKTQEGRGIEQTASVADVHAESSLAGC